MTDQRIELIRKLLPQALLSDWVRLGARLVRLLRDHHHPRAHDAILNRLLVQAEASVKLRERRRANMPSLSYPPELPITIRKDEIVAAIRNQPVVIIAGETGSGKTTQLPKMCLEAGLGIEGKVGCTQPRRVAALSISRRIAEELNVEWGREVGCKIRFDDRTDAQTYIKLMTDGILLAEIQSDPLLAEYNAIIIDEAHERSLNIDFLLGYLKGLMVRRPELKLIITSATIDTAAFSKAFGNAPVIEVSGRVYPVDVVYAPLDPASEETGDLTYIDATVRAVEQVLCEPGEGDALVFLPSERDIRETTDLLEGRFGSEAQTIPLFGRLSSSDQQRVFALSPQRKIVVATNIAETSLTIPRIRYVIDSGLARVSRYNSRTRTKRLPIEPISQSSANQRKGRSGRVQQGVCIRLYSEEDFKSRPEFTQPEIQRSNLAEVILRMKAFGLGEIETFPFVNPPTPAAIQGGYLLLQELGALDSSRELTTLGHDIARLPIDPTLGRMLLQAQEEQAARELLIIASGLSIQDPRERPFDQKDAAAAAHGRFTDPRSDFLTLLNIWNAVHDEWEKLRTQNQRRKFCKTHFLSYLRMREWQDLYAQLHSALEDLRNRPATQTRHSHAFETDRNRSVALGPFRLNERDASYEAVHRAILSGLLGHVAVRTDRNQYQGPGNRKLAVFPGSALYTRAEPVQKTRPNHGKPTARNLRTQQPNWIVASEIVETSQLFARTIAGIDPLWITQIAPHLCKVTHHNPRWSARSGRVLVDEKVWLYGLEVLTRKVAYGNINPKGATELFIRSALVEEALLPQTEPEGEEDKDIDALRNTCSIRQVPVQSGRDGQRFPARYDFLNHNHLVRQKIENWQTRLRRFDTIEVEQALFDFYRQRFENVSSVDELNRFLRHEPNRKLLFATEQDLVGHQDLTYDTTAFPDAVSLEGQSAPISYAYKPGDEHDGVTIQLGAALAQTVSPASVEWAVPGLREAQITELLRALPKSLRRDLMPFPPKVAEILRDLQPTGMSLLEDLSKFVRQRYGVSIPVSAWNADSLPAHLRPRVQIVTANRETLGTGRNLGELRKLLEKVRVDPSSENPAWAQATKRWERFGLTSWNFGDLPEQIVVSEAERVYAWPGLQLEDGMVSLRLFGGREAASLSSLPGVRRLVELALGKELAWLEKDLRSLARLLPLLQGRWTVDELQAAALAHLRDYLLPCEPMQPLTAAKFQAAVSEARERLSMLPPRFFDQLKAILELRAEFLRRFVPSTRPTHAGQTTLSSFQQLGGTPSVASRTPSALVGELDTLISRNFLQEIPYSKLEHIPRYLKALLVRGDRAALNPLKDRERASQIAPYQEALRRLQSNPQNSKSKNPSVEALRWMIEEFKVSLFAQELGTAMPISARRLDDHIANLA